MIKAEFKYFKKHWFQLVVLIIIALIPAIYSVTFLQSMWDPYGKLDDLNVAVVNHDQPAKMNGKQMALGNDLADTLAKSDSLHFHVVSTTKANKELKNGHYYAIYTIPKDFSRDAGTVFTAHPKQLQLHETLSSGHSFIASKMVGSAGSRIQSTVNGELNAAYTKTLVDGFKQVGSGMKQAQNGADKLAAGSTKVNNGIGQFQNGLATAANGEQTLATSATKLANGTQQYTAGVTSAQNGSQTLSNSLAQLNAGLPGLSSGLNRMATGTSSLSTGLASAQNGSATLAQGAATLSQNMNTFTNSTTTLASKTKTLSAGLDSFAAQVKQSEQGGTGNLSQLAKLIQATQCTLNQLTQAESQTATAASDNVASAAAGMHLTATQTAQLKAAVTKTYDESAVKQEAALKPLLTQLQTALTGLQRNSATQQQSASKVTDALNQLTSGAATLANGNAQLAGAASKLNAGTASLASGANTLNAGTTNLAKGAATLNNGIQSSLPKVGTLTAGAAKLGAGANQLNSGLTTLNGNGNTLSNGTQQLATGAGKHANGGQQLTAGVATLKTGTASLAAGTTQLATKLGNGTKALPTLHYNKTTAKMTATPVNLKTSDTDNTPNNGTAMMPYMGGIALWVCALAVNLMFDLTTPRKQPKHVWDLWASKSTVIYLTVFGAATVEYLALLAFTNLRPDNSLATYAVLVITGLALMSIVTWLNLALNKAGSFLALILLVLQLGSSGGTYPLELTNGFFQAIHPYLPLTYIVDALRHTVTMNVWPTPDVLILLGFFIVFTLLNLLNYVRRALRTSESDYEALEE